MITDGEIESAKARGVLFPFEPPVGWVSGVRAFLMTRRLKAEIEDGCRSSDPVRVARWEALRADMTHYVSGDRIWWGRMKWLEPKKFEIWTLRSVVPNPSLRVFGRFAQVDVFVGTHVKERGSLGRKFSLAWELEKLECEAEWEKAFATGAPLRCDTFEDYFSGNAHKAPRI